MSKYRDTEVTIYESTEICEEQGIDNNTKWIEHDEFIKVIDSIESDLNAISELLKSIEGLDLIDDAKELLRDLIVDVY